MSSTKNKTLFFPVLSFPESSAICICIGRWQNDKLINTYNHIQQARRSYIYDLHLLHRFLASGTTHGRHFLMKFYLVYSTALSWYYREKLVLNRGGGHQYHYRTITAAHPASWEVLHLHFKRPTVITNQSITLS